MPQNRTSSAHLGRLTARSGQVWTIPRPVWDRPADRLSATPTPRRFIPLGVLLSGSREVAERLPKATKSVAQSSRHPATEEER